MSVPVEPAIQRQYDAISAEHRAAGAEIAAELRARLREVAGRVAARPEPPAPRSRRGEANDLPALATHYQEPGDDPEPSRLRPVSPPDAADDEDVPSFQWDEV